MGTPCLRLDALAIIVLPPVAKYELFSGTSFEFASDYTAI